MHRTSYRAQDITPRSRLYLDVIPRYPFAVAVSRPGAEDREAGAGATLEAQTPWASVPPPVRTEARRTLEKGFLAFLSAGSVLGPPVPGMHPLDPLCRAHACLKLENVPIGRREALGAPHEAQVALRAQLPSAGIAA